MILYHGSIVPVEKPEIRKGNYFLDFGVGFYTTTSYEQAVRWAQIKMRREDKSCGYVSSYEFDLETAKKMTVIRRFDSADMIWLQFVVGNRRGENPNDASDIHHRSCCR